MRDTAKLLQSRATCLAHGVDRETDLHCIRSAAESSE